jgi:hypothetical protein
MNAPAQLFVNAHHLRLASRLVAAVGACAMLSGCIGDLSRQAQIDPSSPVAPDVAKLSRANTDYPAFNEIPAKPTDVRPPQMYGQDADAVLAARDQVVAATADNTWTLSNTEGFAASAQRAAGANIAPPSATETEAFANSLRQRATPPPPPKR